MAAILNDDEDHSFLSWVKNVNCRTCLDLISGTDYKEKKAKLPKIRHNVRNVGFLVVQHIC